MSRGNRVECSRSRFHTLKKCAKHNGDTHGNLIAHQLWKNAGVLAAHLQWDLADRAANLAIRLNGRVPTHGGSLFRAAAAIHPRLGLRIREWAIRVLKPSLRKEGRYGGTEIFALVSGG
jgi:hypothetical protein